MAISSSARSLKAALAPLLLLLAACSMRIGPPPQDVITGTATYRERIALPPGAQLEASLENVSRADAPSTQIASTRVPAAGVPIHFAIRYDPAQVRTGERHVVRARIRSGDTVLFTTDHAYPVLGPGGPTHVDVLLRRAAAQPVGSRRMVGLSTSFSDRVISVRPQSDSAP